MSIGISKIVLLSPPSRDQSTRWTKGETNITSVVFSPVRDGSPNLNNIFPSLSSTSAHALLYTLSRRHRLAFMCKRFRTVFPWKPWSLGGFHELEPRLPQINRQWVRISSYIGHSLRTTAPTISNCYMQKRKSSNFLKFSTKLTLEPIWPAYYVMPKSEYRSCDIGNTVRDTKENETMCMVHHMR